MSREQRVMEELAGYAPEIGRWLWALEDARRRTRQRLDGFDPALIDWVAPSGSNSVGSILYHIAAIEADYLYVDILEQPFPPDLAALFPYDVREESGRLTAIQGHDLAWYIHRLDDTRARLLEAFRAIRVDDFRRPRGLAEYDITPEWTLHHLMQHEAEHRGELASMRARAEQEA